MRDEKKVSKLGELGNLIAQYNAGVRDTINADEYPQWMLMYEMLSNADIDDSILMILLKSYTLQRLLMGKLYIMTTGKQKQQQKNKKEFQSCISLNKIFILIFVFRQELLTTH